MAFNTASFLAGVGSVVVVLSTGFAGGYFFASPDDHVPPNRLQRVASDRTAIKDTDAKAASATTSQAKPDVAAAIVAPAEVKSPPASTTSSSAAETSAPPVPAPTVQHASTEQPSTPAAPEQAASTSDQAKADQPGSEREAANNKERAHAAGAKVASRRRAEARRFAEQQRRQHELEVAAGAVRHIIHGRDGEEIIVRNGYMPDREIMPDREVMEVDQAEPPGPDMRPFNFFGR